MVSKTLVKWQDEVLAIARLLHVALAWFGGGSGV